MAHKGNENLIVPTSEQAREYGRKGGLASAEARARKKAMKESLEILLKLATRDADVIDIENANSIMDLNGASITVEQQILIAQILRAMKGDIRAAEFIRDTSGQKPIERVEVANKDETIKEMEKYFYGEGTDFSFD